MVPMTLGVELWPEPAEHPADGNVSAYAVDLEVLERWRVARSGYLQARAALVGQLERQGWRAQPATEFVNICFDRGPGPWPQQLIDVEDDQGRSVNYGDWLEREDGTWALRVPR
jgi:hypothetical protein